MAKKIHAEPLDEEELLSIASGMSSFTPPQKGKPLAPAPAASAPTVPESSYADLFLVRCTVQRRVAVYVSEQVRDSIAAVVRTLGCDGSLSAAGYIENVLRHHLQTYRDDINACYKAQCHKKDLL